MGMSFGPPANDRWGDHLTRFRVHGSLEQFLAHVARRGSSIGGGSAAAVTAALSAALLEKLVVQPQAARRLRRIRQDCLRLAEADAVAFAHAVQAKRQGNRQAFHRALQRATRIPQRIVEHASAIQAACSTSKPFVKPQFRSDLRCASALAKASADSANTLINANLAWLKHS